MRQEIRFATAMGHDLPAILNMPDDADVLFVMGHGSGSTIHAPLMTALGTALGSVGIATLCFEYPYSAHPDFIPFTDMPTDPDDVLIDTLRAALIAGTDLHPDLTILVGGHSVSGLMTTFAEAQDPLRSAGIVALAFPRKGDPARSDHLSTLQAPLLVVQGTKDALGQVDEIEAMITPLQNRATLRWVPDGSHTFDVPGQDREQVAMTIAEHVRAFADGL